MTIHMTLWLPDFDVEELEMALVMEGIEFEKVNDNIIEAQVEPVYYEYMQTNLRKNVNVITPEPEPNDTPVIGASITTPVEIDIPECIPSEEDIDKLAQEIEERAKAQTEPEPEPIEEPDTSAQDRIKERKRLCKIIYATLMGHKKKSVEFPAITVSTGNASVEISKVLRNTKTSEVEFYATCIKHQNEKLIGTSRTFPMSKIIVLKEYTPAFFENVLELVNQEIDKED